MGIRVEADMAIPAEAVNGGYSGGGGYGGGGYGGGGYG
jgi:hypothetical protein